MPNFIHHRINEISRLQNIDDLSGGCEIDVRSMGSHLILHHDPFSKGDRFESWLECYQSKLPKGTLVLNTKEDGLEEKIIDLLARFSIQEYAFLDTSVPSLVNWTLRKKNKKFFARYSKYEPLEAVFKFRGSCEWVWVDCFDREPLPSETLPLLKQHFKVCLVSPELQGGNRADFVRFIDLAASADSICTKFPKDWMALLSKS